MKHIVNLYFSGIIMVTVAAFGCGDNAAGTNEASGDTIKIQDSSQLNNYDNEQAQQNQIHMKDSNAATDSSKAHGDTTRGRKDSLKVKDSSRRQ